MPNFGETLTGEVRGTPPARSCRKYPPKAHAFKFTNASGDLGQLQLKGSINNHVPEPYLGSLCILVGT